MLLIELYTLNYTWKWEQGKSIIRFSNGTTNFVRPYLLRTPILKVDRTPVENMDISTFIFQPLYQYQHDGYPSNPTADNLLKRHTIQLLHEIFSIMHIFNPSYLLIVSSPKNRSTWYTSWQKITKKYCQPHDHYNETKRESKKWNTCKLLFG